MEPVRGGREIAEMVRMILVFSQNQARKTSKGLSKSLETGRYSSWLGGTELCPMPLQKCFILLRQMSPL